LFFVCMVCYHAKENLMSIILVILVLALIGFILWLVEKYVPMDPQIKTIIRIVVIVCVIIWLLNVFGLWALILSAKI
jgi:hypothetical protein